MRIIGGTRRGTRLSSPRTQAIRPTGDRVRESVFNILAHHVDGAGVLDLFAGTGAMGLEALSRGAVSAVFVDHQPEALALIEKNLSTCGWIDRAQIIRWDLSLNLNCLSSLNEVFNLVFIDPPYRSQMIPTILNHLAHSRALVPEARVLIEHSSKSVTTEFPHPFTLEDQRRYGKTLVSFFRYMV